MDEWRKWPRVTDGRQPRPANGKRYRAIHIFDLMSCGRCCMGYTPYVGPLREHSQTFDAQPRRSPFGGDQCTVGVRLGPDGYERVHRRYLFNASGKLVIWGEAWSVSDVVKSGGSHG